MATGPLGMTKIGFTMFAAALSAITCAACATGAHPDGPPPDGLTWEAVTLKVVVSQGCMPYALGERTEAVAMKNAALRRDAPRFSWPSPGVTEPQYVNDMAGVPIVTIYGSDCTVYVRGRDAAAFDRALDQVYRARFGQTYNARSLPPPPYANFPDTKMFCQAGRLFVSYPDPPTSVSHGGYNVAIRTEKTCSASSL